jgi:hypothetical protein
MQKYFGTKKSTAIVKLTTSQHSDHSAFSCVDVSAYREANINVMLGHNLPDKHICNLSLLALPCA